MPVNINLNNVQPTLVSGTNIKTVNSNSLLGSGNVAVQDVLVSGTNIKTINGNTILGSGDITVGGGITVGTTAITSGTDTRVFFQQGGVVQQDANFTFDNTQKRLTLRAGGATASDIPFLVQNSAATANLISIQGNNIGNFSKVYFDLNSGVPQLFNIDTSAAAGASFLLGTSTISLRDANANFVRFIGGGVRSVAVSNGAANTGLADAFEMYSADRGGVNGRASAHFRSEDGTINVLGDLSGIGTATPQARLDVRAQGALSTDIAFRVRNSANSVNSVEYNGDGSKYWRAHSGDMHFAFDPANNRIHLKRTGNYLIQTDNAVTELQMACNTGNLQLRGGSKLLHIYSGGNFHLGGTALLAGSGDGNLIFQNGTAPSTNLIDRHYYYSADIVAGNAAPHFRTENGSIIKLFQGAALTASDGTLANAVTRIAELEARLQAHGLIA